MAIALALGRMGATAIEPLLEYNAVPGIRLPALRPLSRWARLSRRTSSRPCPPRSKQQRRRPGSARHRHPRARQVRRVDPRGQPASDLAAAIVERLRTNLADKNPAIRAKAVRSMGKLARTGTCPPNKRRVVRCLHRILGEDEAYEWDRAYVVRKEAREALEYV